MNPNVVPRIVSVEAARLETIGGQPHLVLDCPQGFRLIVSVRVLAQAAFLILSASAAGTTR